MDVRNFHLVNIIILTEEFVHFNNEENLQLIYGYLRRIQDLDSDLYQSLKSFDPIKNDCLKVLYKIYRGDSIEEPSFEEPSFEEPEKVILNEEETPIVPIASRGMEFVENKNPIKIDNETKIEDEFDI